jgi:hypothetical protein
MKLSPILIAAAVAFGGNALAQSRDTDTKVERAGERAAANTREAGRDAADATRRGTQRAADATRRTGERAADSTRRADDRTAARAGEPSTTDKAKRGAQRAADATRSGAKKAATVTGNVARKGADRVRSAGQAIERRLPPGPDTAQAQRGTSGEAGGTTAMGAGPAATTASASNDGDRRQRMDDAYSNYRRQQSR